MGAKLELYRCADSLQGGAQESAVSETGFELPSQSCGRENAMRFGEPVIGRLEIKEARTWYVVSPSDGWVGSISQTISENNFLARSLLQTLVAEQNA